MTTQSVVIYTPVQDALYNSGLLIPLIGGMAAGVLVFVALSMMFGRWVNSPGGRRWADWIMGGSAVIALTLAGFVFHKLAS